MSTAADQIIPNAGLHLTSYTVVLSQSGETFCSTTKTLCATCAAKTPGTSKMGEVINGYCDGCGVGPSVPHFRLVRPLSSCVACGDPLDWSGPGLCQACREWGEPITH